MTRVHVYERPDGGAEVPAGTAAAAGNGQIRVSKIIYRIRVGDGKAAKEKDSPLEGSRCGG